MADFIHDPLLQAFIDGELKADERVRLERLLDADETVRQRLAELQRVSALLSQVKDVSPRPTIVGEVMRRVERVGASRREEQVSSGGMGMAKKVLLGLAAAAAIVLAIFSYAGFPPAGWGTEGTIGAANRYRAAQISDKDVILGDTSAQQFIQSDTFASLLKDPAAMKLLSDAKFRAELIAPGVAQALRAPELAAMLTKSDLVTALQNYGRNCTTCGPALQNSDFVASLTNPAIRAAIADPQFVARIRANDLEAALKSPAMASALAACATGCNGLVRAMQSPQIVAALQDKQFAVALQDKNFITGVQNASFVAGLLNQQFVAAIQSPGFVAALADGRLSAALQNQAFRTALTNNGFFAALQDARFVQALNNANALAHE